MSNQPPPRFDLIRARGPGHDSAAHRAQLAARRLPPSLTDPDQGSRDYQPTAALMTAINTAIAVAAPLLLTGEPGTGKTQVAGYIGDYFGIPVFPFQVRSTSTADELKYDFDAVAYLHWAQSARAAGGNGPHQPRWAQAHRERRSDQRQRSAFLTPCPLWRAYAHNGDAVVLIDEIDKAPRDFPNDLLHELDQHQFPHPFEPRIIAPRSGRPPIVIITSNDERRLPDAFLRRCIFYRIELTATLIKDATEARIGDFPDLDSDTRKAARERFWELRNSGIDKPPSTAELLVWLSILSARGITAADLRDRPLRALPAIEALVKDKDDLEVLG